MRFEWDPGKARANRAKHGVTFEDAMWVFSDPDALVELDLHSGEQRWRTLGAAGPMIVLLVVHTVSDGVGGEVIRLISARRATRKERHRYEQSRH